MNCKNNLPMRDQILAAATTPRELFIHRFARCCHATGCGRLCERLIKSPGAALVQCYANYPAAPSEIIDLYVRLEDREFVCPAGLF